MLPRDHCKSLYIRVIFISRKPHPRIISRIHEFAMAGLEIYIRDCLNLISAIFQGRLKLISILCRSYSRLMFVDIVGK
jgi:hypothetical protein